MALWTPDLLGSALVGWWDFSDASSLTLNGSTISSVANKGSGPPMAQATAANQPALTSSAIGGLSASSYSGSKFLAAASVAFGQTYTIGAILEPTTVSGNPTAFNADGGSPRIGQFIRLNGATFQTIGFDSGSAAYMATSGAITASTIYIVTTSSTATALNLYLNGSLAATIARSNTRASGTRSAQIGVGINGNSNYWSGLIGEVDYASGISDDATRQYFEGYLAWKWGLQGNLPTSHPYYSAAPQAPVVLTANPGTFSVAGQPATFTLVNFIAFDPGTLSLNGQTATFRGSLSAQAASFAVTGLAGTFGRLTTLGASLGSYAVVGQLATFVQSSMLAASPNSFAITGQPVTFNTQAQGVLAVGRGAIIVSGGVATLGGYLGVQPGSANLAGGVAAFGQTATLILSQGIYTIYSQSASFSFAGSSYIAANDGAFLVSGGLASFRKLGIPIGVYSRYDPYTAGSYTPYIISDNSNYQNYSPLIGEQS